MVFNLFVYTKLTGENEILIVHDLNCKVDQHLEDVIWNQPIIIEFKSYFCLRTYAQLVLFIKYAHSVDHKCDISFQIWVLSSLYKTS